MNLRIIITIVSLLISIFLLLYMKSKGYKDYGKISKRVLIGFYLQVVGLLSILILLLAQKPVPDFMGLIYTLGLMIVIVFSLLDLKARKSKKQTH